MIELESNDPELIAEIGRSSLQNKCRKYSSTLTDNVDSCFQSVHVHLITFLSLLNLRNSQSVKPESIMELREYFDMDGSKLWNEFESYMSLVSDSGPKTITKAVYEMWCLEAVDNMKIAFLLTYSLLARIFFLPASFA